MTDSLIIGISGASGAIYGIRLLEILRKVGVESHLIVSNYAKLTIAAETDYSLEQVKDMADKVYNINDMAACISSGSHPTQGMIIAPCSMRSLGEIASGVTTTLLTRSADVTLKERRRLVLMTRETPLHRSYRGKSLTGKHESSQSDRICNLRRTRGTTHSLRQHF